MKTIVSSLVLVGLLALLGGSRLCATAPPKSPDKGKVLLLRNEHTMEGDIERVGDRYLVRRRIGETWVPCAQVLCLVASLPDAYAYLKARANLHDADERLRLANWCRLNGLHEQALAEIEAAAQLRPDHEETRRLLQHLKQTAQTPAAPKPAASTTPTPAAQPTPPVELTTEAIGLFATRVQPILMNTCANCHATGRGGAFRLTEVYGGGLSNRKAFEQNLAAVLAQINVHQPESSRLLTKAISDHAHTGRPPLRDRKDAPYRTLENWIKQTVADNPHLRDTQPAPAVAPAAPPSANPERHPATTEASSQWGADARPAANPASPSVPSPAPVPVSRTTAAPPPPPPPTGPADPYDPEPFNRQSHPETNKPGPAK